MKLTGGEKLHDQLTTLSEHPEAIRAQVVEAVHAAVPNQAGMFFNCVTQDARLHYGEVVVAGDPRLAEELPKHASGPVTDTTWCPRLLDPASVNRFARLRAGEDDARLLSNRVVERVLEPMEIEDQLRAVLFDGPTFLGWIGLMRRRDETSKKGFSAKEQRVLATATPQIKSALAAAQALEDEQLATGACAVYTAEGVLEHASDSFTRWLNPHRASFIAGWARGFDAGNDQSVMKLVGGAEIRLVRLDGAIGVRYLVTLARARTIKLSPTHCLTPRQREIAEFAVVGATSREIAKHLSISAETVKTHIRNIYERLGVASRMELSQLMDG